MKFAYSPRKDHEIQNDGDDADSIALISVM